MNRRKGFVDGPALPGPRLLLGAFVLLALTATGARAWEAGTIETVRNDVIVDDIGPYSITDGPDPIQVTCDSEGEVEIATVNGLRWANADDLAADCIAGLESHAADLGDTPSNIDNIETEGACGSTGECVTHCTTQCLYRGGHTRAELVDDLQSRATGKACSCKCGNAQTVYTICISQRKR